MDVHLPEHPILSWRDFFIHLATITVGLLIAIGLEQSVEALHRRHLLHVAENNLALELEANRRTLEKDQRQLSLSQTQMLAVLHAVSDLRAHKPVSRLEANWTWDDLQSGAWETARSNGSVALLTYADAQEHTDRYHQQDLVNQQANSYIKSVYAMTVPFMAGKKPQDMTAWDLDRLEASSEEALADLGHLKSLCRGLEQEYKGAAH